MKRSSIKCTADDQHQNGMAWALCEMRGCLGAWTGLGGDGWRNDGLIKRKQYIECIKGIFWKGSLRVFVVSVIYPWPGEWPSHNIFGFCQLACVEDIIFAWEWMDVSFTRLSSLPSPSYSTILCPQAGNKHKWDIEWHMTGIWALRGALWPEWKTHVIQTMPRFSQTTSSVVAHRCETIMIF